MFDLYEELSAIVDALESGGLEYAVCGGIAMAVHGFTRATEDIDLFLPAENVTSNDWRGRMNQVDYSDRAITMRLKRLSQLRKLCLSLAKAKPLPPPKPPSGRSA